MHGMNKDCDWWPQQMRTVLRARPDGGVRVAAFLAHLVAETMDVDADRLLSRERGVRQVSRGRQIAMYLMHTSLSASHNQVARAFARDRSTVAHACRSIEDARDDPVIERRLGVLEAMLEPIAPCLVTEMGR